MDESKGITDLAKRLYESLKGVGLYGYLKEFQVLIAAGLLSIVLVASTWFSHNVGRYQIAVTSDSGRVLSTTIDTKTGQVVKKEKHGTFTYTFAK